MGRRLQCRRSGRRRACSRTRRLLRVRNSDIARLWPGFSFKPHNVAATIDANELVLPLISTTLGVGKGATGCNPERTQVTVETWTPGLARNTRGETEVVGMTANRAFYLAVN